MKTRIVIVDDHTILREGTSADKQLRVYREHGGDANNETALRAVVDSVAAETMIC